ncbi:hypothetical protein OO306_05260 [Pseudomonas sp. DCB_AW]|jgi:hypothetical protein|uniref:hypothetical protein n=1 Tax=Pseudomonas sp. DCB_AW TaxID=2993596 RepID=UPI0022489E2A|nr:hypothetical protein [Pseudomonas sp. DCB_AW]MCX2684957.1 hypothetical protein [Pseudomonas sp. DCB_AW]
MSTEKTTLEAFKQFLDNQLDYTDEIDETTSLLDINGDGNRWIRALLREFNELEISISELSKLGTVGELLNKINGTE